MPEATAPAAPKADTTPATKKIPGLAMGRIVHARDAVGTVRAAIITNVVDESEGLVNLVEFARYAGEESATNVTGYRYAPDGKGNQRWWFPTKE